MPRIFLKPKSAEYADPETSKAQAATQFCDMPGCTTAATHRAPRDRSLESYYNFCLEHVQEYNKAWDYFSGMSAEDIESHIHRSVHGDRPTWIYGVNTDFFREFEDKIRDAAGWERKDRKKEQEQQRGRHRSYYENTPEFDAMAIMGLEPPLTLEDIKARYKELVKKHHPDRNPDDKNAEELLKSINMAYTILKMSYEKYEKLTS